jgi:hypothetical protein
MFNDGTIKNGRARLEVVSADAENEVHFSENEPTSEPRSFERAATTESPRGSVTEDSSVFFADSDEDGTE